jgi:hypothetical protein
MKGHYRIDGIPVGKATVSTRLAAIQQEASKPIEVRPNVVLSVDLQLTYKPKPPAPRVDAGPPPSSVNK